jgi:hypothetical protein
VEFLLTNIFSGEYHRGSPATSRIWETVSIKTYSRSQGLFAGASLEGTVLVASTLGNTGSRSCVVECLHLRALDP